MYSSGDGMPKESVDLKKIMQPNVNRPKVNEANTCNAKEKETLLLKNKAKEVSLSLDGKNIFLVGMMGCGKTTVGKIMSEALGYSFFDSDQLIERTVGGTPIAKLFIEKNEEYFRDIESEVLSNLSSMHHRVVATGGGVVVRPQNWMYLKQGFTIWLDVPLETLVKRVIAVGIESRPLLGQVSFDPYSQVIARLGELIEQRGEAYANSDVKVSLQNIATELGFEDVCALTPIIIATKVLQAMGNFLHTKM